MEHTVKSFTPQGEESHPPNPKTMRDIDLENIKVPTFRSYTARQRRKKLALALSLLMFVLGAALGGLVR